MTVGSSGFGCRIGCSCFRSPAVLEPLNCPCYRISQDVNMSASGPQLRGLSAVPPLQGQRRTSGDPTAPATPEELLSRTALGDERAFEVLYDAFAGRVFGLARRIVRNPGQA